ncbi:outer membrane beta-barrel protein [Larkinella terrae]|uniref:Outer membrane beta-barrel protein n=1 Tax=Larkinella terrae TaxID=2025311 RepID=A0A7K0EP25_9BACT|nr:outer membrane beta-barrel protein [Larkinella terrae]MRS63246.1 outer membrane beta-barrel protein [Larkinella terrae]
MKTFHYFLLAALGFYSISSKAQIFKNSTWGITTGISNTNVGYIKPFSRYSITGFKVGVYGLKELNTNYELTFAVNASRYGQRTYLTTRFISPPNLDTTFYNMYEEYFTYLTFYPQLRYYPLKFGKIKPFIGFGLFAGYLIKSKGFSYTGDGLLISTTVQTRGFYRLNYGVNLDLGLKIHLGKLKKPVWVALSYEPGIADIVHSRSKNPGFTYKTSAYSLNVYYPISSR